MARYNEKIRDIYGLNPTKGEVGIEIELEGRNVLMSDVPPYWKYHPDGSLRGESAEYVLTKPVSRDSVPDALNVLFKMLKLHGTKIREDSPNTSVHVHLNVQEWTLKKVYNLITVWYIFEKMLVQWCGEEREGNLFCLRGCDAEVLLQRLASAVRYSKFNTINDPEGLRYSAFNPTSMGKFGSVEIRSLAGVYNEDVINTWVQILLSLKDFAELFESPPDIIIEMSRSSSEEFLRAALPQHWRLFSQPGYGTLMKEGMRLIQGVAYAVNWERQDAPVKKKQWVEDDIDALDGPLLPVAPRGVVRGLPLPRPLIEERLAEWRELNGR